MHSHPAKPLPTVAINALWCLLIALTLLALPIIARQIRLHTGSSSTLRSISAPAATETPAPATSSAVLLTQTESPRAQR